ncbi:MAG: PKD domain-containing protein [Flavipsychrobacter sp.]|nr:PKD domain-containing protein [Flavipsychrobacter sp.]
MNLKKYLKPFFTLAFCWSFAAQAQVDIVNNDTTICEGAQFNIHANTNGRVPIPIPLNQDDVYSGIINIGFPFTFYGVSYTQCVVSANGFISFDLFNANAPSPWNFEFGPGIPGNTQCLNAIMSPYSDIDPSVGGGSIDYALMGTAPNRRFVVSFCHAPLYSCNNLYSSFQIILYETSNQIDMHVINQSSALCTWNGGMAIEGVQDATGTYATVVPGRNWPNQWTAYGSSHRFTPNGPTDYTVASIPHAPIPDSSATIYWFSGGFQVGTGHDFLYSYTSSQTLVAMVTQCQDTMTDTIHVTVEQIYNITDVDSTNPTQCEASDGTISLFGFFPGLTYTIHYTDPFGQPVTLTGTANNQGVLLITGLVEGNYTNFYVISSAGCVSNIWPSIPLYDPPVNIDQALPVATSFCQATDGAIRLTGLIAGVTYDVTYWFQGVPTTVTLTADGNGVVTIPNLAAGTYTTISATTANCTSNTVGPVTLVDPLPDIDQVQPNHPSLCRAMDGFIVLTGLIADSPYVVHYTVNTVPFTVGPIGANGNGELTIPNLGAGVYANITVTLMSCTSPPAGPVTLQNPPITADFTYTLLPGCTEDTIVFTDNSSGSAYPFDYTWTFDDGGKDSVQNPIHIYAEQGTYSVKLEISDSVCYDSTVIDVVIDHPLVANFTVDEDTICQGTQITFTDASTATPPVSYYWDFGNGQTNGFSVPSATSVYPRAGDHMAMLVITDFIGCKDTAYKYIRVDSLTEIHMSFSRNPICAGEEVTVFATYADTGSTGVNWDFGDGIVTQTFGHQIDHSYEQAGIYPVHVIATGRVCPDVDSTLTLTVLPQPVINLGVDTFMCPNSEPLILNDLINAGNASATWEWRHDNVLQPETSFNFVVRGQGVYMGKVTIGECSATDSVWVRKDCYIDVPNAFTPDGDNMNDYFFPRQWLSRGVTTFKFLIYNRWGQEIYSTTNIEGRGWDGKFNGVDQPQGVYVYVIDVTFKDGRSEHKQGNVTLLR